MADYDPRKIRIDCLDGLRGLASLWVMIGHALLLTGWRLPVLSEPDLGVDLFIMLSGFLMVFHYQLRAAKEPWDLTSTWGRFWIRRFLRIAPLYYVLLAVAFALGAWLFDSRMVIDQFLGRAPQSPQRYLDNGLTNGLMHASFLFGLSPDYAYRTPLPDWSIGLEMQFYAAFPFIMLLLKKGGWLKGALYTAIIALAIVSTSSVLGVHFPMPAFLPLKMHIFLCGMLLALGLHADRSKAFLHGGAAMALALLPIGGDMTITKMVMRVTLVAVFFALLYHRLIGSTVGVRLRAFSSSLGNRFFHWLGELSFGAYLWHLIFLQPIAAYFITAFGDTLTPAARFAVVTAILVPLVYAAACMTFFAVEKPGQRLAKRFINRGKLQPAGA
ncbi:peptidoglycan/LPS O-acetylase OafA/YrhL [Sinorhizobium terangae]|uniref:Acyltransferase family protein n=1 Tax=Sinorhizobium terangae TaxID=110322 RepID=A0A6N7LJB2_SINTE|nr:acyltransferase [Sinorhizobium terangae]MBB4184655.1 peptidoglycan/LPS O-acetylase OafA/YrhL [Sinorhizobium terangae]MQX16834.1 acyltransferase family protein [Sinorhizobium terangae]